MTRHLFLWMAAAAVGAVTVGLGAWNAGLADLFSQVEDLPVLARALGALLVFAVSLCGGLAVLVWNIGELRKEDRGGDARQPAVGRGAGQSGARNEEEDERAA